MDKGHNFLHNHPMTEKNLGLDEQHVIVDRNAWEEARKQVLNLGIPFVSGSALDDSERMYYDSLRECCNKILDAVDAGKVPQRAIMGLRLLMNR